MVYGISKSGNPEDTRKLEPGDGIIYRGVPSFFGFGLGDGNVQTFWILLQVNECKTVFQYGTAIR